MFEVYKDRPCLFFLCGVPASGKSTFANKYLSHCVRVSTDDVVDQYARSVGITYTAAFKELPRNYAENVMYSRLAEAVSERKNIVWDQTNLTAKSRKEKLVTKFNILNNADLYTKICIFFFCPHDQSSRLKNDDRVGKEIPQEILNNMSKQYEQPTYNEPWDYIFCGSNLSYLEKLNGD